jgi:hypothetical protein
MTVDPTISVGIATVAGLVLIAVRSNRNDQHPYISAFSWMSALTLLVWTVMVWLATK